MQPFILKYAKQRGAAINDKPSNMSYDVEIEAMAKINRDQIKYAIDDQNAVWLTGSYITKAESDPTTDESTDR